MRAVMARSIAFDLRRGTYGMATVARSGTIPGDQGYPKRRKVCDTPECETPRLRGAKHCWFHGTVDA